LIGVDDNIPLGHHLLHRIIHLLIVFSQQLKLFGIDLFEQVVDIDVLNPHRNLLFKLLVFLLKILVPSDSLGVTLRKLLLLDVQHLVLRVKLRVLHPHLKQLLPVALLLARIFHHFLLQIHKLLLQLQLIVKHLLALVLFVLSLFDEDNARLLQIVKVGLLLNLNLPLLVPLPLLNLILVHRPAVDGLLQL
jgi:hypothetical protein